MLRVFDDLGFAVTRETDQQTVHVTCSVLPDEKSLAVMDERERAADVSSLAPLLAPRSVVVIGASRRPGAVGHELLRSVLGGGYSGQVFAVGHADGNVLGLHVEKSVLDLPSAPDL